jgi:protein TonB
MRTSIAKRCIALCALVLAACTPGQPPQRGGPVAVPDTSGAAPSAAPAAGATPSAAPPAKALSPLDEYKQRAATRIVQANTPHVFDGEPPHLLKSVIVVVVNIDARGNVTASRIMRGNGYRDLEQLALASVKRAAPFDAPPRSIMRGSSFEMTETWLFRNDNKFQIRSIAAPQPTVAPEPDEPRKRRG